MKGGAVITASTSGSTGRTESWLRRMAKNDIFSRLERYGREGVNALASATPTDTGLTASSWTYEIIQDATSYSIVWGNTNVVDGRPVAILLQYGHGTGTGGYVQGQDYINPALAPVFDRIAAEVQKAVSA